MHLAALFIRAKRSACHPEPVEGLQRRPLTTQILRIMKLTFILLTAAFLQVSATGTAQGINLSLKNASLAKVFCTLRTRDIVTRAREVMSGNGILLEYDVARFLADAEAIYSYEGTKEINSLIVGRSITGFSAFV